MAPPPLPPQSLEYARQVIPVGGGIWRRGDQLITGRDVQLPDTCIRCNEPGVKRLRRHVYWHEPWVYILILPGLLIYAIVALALRKKATYTCTLCEKHAKRRTTHILIGWVIALSGVGFIVLGVMGANDAFGRDLRDVGGMGIILGIVTLLAAAIYSIITMPLLKPKKIDEQYAYLSGAGPAFLANFSEV
jgi:hypothetical protein